MFILKVIARNETKEKSARPEKCQRVDEARHIHASREEPRGREKNLEAGECFEQDGKKQPTYLRGSRDWGRRIRRGKKKSGVLL